MTNSSPTRNIICWTFGMLFFVIGILNMILVHVVPGIIYVLISLIYLPTVDTWMKAKLGFSIPFIAKVIVGLVILWATLAVGDLMEVFEGYMGH